MDEPEYPLNRSPVICTRDPEEMRHALFTVYGAKGFALPKAEGFEGVANYLELPNVGIGFCGYGAKTIVDFPELDVARLQIPLKGVATTNLDRGPNMIVEHQPTMIPPGKAATLDFEAGYEQLILRISSPALESALTTLLGARPRGALIFDPAMPAKQPSGQLLRELTIFLAKQLEFSGGSAAQLNAGRTGAIAHCRLPVCPTA